MFTWYRELIRLRRTHPCLQNSEPGNTVVTFDEQENWIRIQRGTITVICNLGVLEHTFVTSDESKVLITSGETLKKTDLEIVLPPDTLAVLKGPVPL
jgi:maltooligosyltrehalose trehalohydrolase